MFFLRREWCHVGFSPIYPFAYFTAAKVFVVYCLRAFVLKLHVLACMRVLAMHFFFFLNWLQCKLLEMLWQGHQERLDSSVSVPITGWEGTRWRTNEGWTNLLNDTTWNAAFKIPSGLPSPRTWSVKHDTYLYTCWWSTQACPIGWWHVRSAGWPPNPAALVWFSSLPLSPSTSQRLNFGWKLVFGCSWRLSLFAMALGACDWDWGSGCSSLVAHWL